MATRQQIINKAAGELGTTEQGNNKVKYNNYNGLAWCAYFVSWIMSKCGMSQSEAPQYPACITMMSKYQALGRYKSRGSYTPQTGDVIFFHFSSGHSGANHVGIVEYVSGGTVHTIEGNTSNKVARRSYSASSGSILGYGLPSYDGSSSYSDYSGTSAVSSTSEAPPHIPQTTKEYTVYESDKIDKSVDEYRLVWENSSGVARDITDRVGSIKMKDDSASICTELSFSVMQSTDERFIESLELECGDFISLSNKSSGECVFLGQIQTTAGSYRDSISYTCYDQGRILNCNDVIIQFNNCNAKEAITEIAKRLGIKNVSIPNLTSSVYGIYKESAGTIIQNILETITSENGVSYFPRMIGNTLTIRSYSQTAIDAYGKQSNNVQPFKVQDECSAPSISRSITDLKNEIVIYSESDSSVSIQADIESTESVKRYGRRVGVESFSDSDSMSAVEKAKNLLASKNVVNESFSVTTFGSDAVVAGSRLTFSIKEAAGDYWVEAVEHDYGNPHTMTLTLRKVG